MEVSNHLPKTKDRSSLIFWTPFSWGVGEECIQRLENLVNSESLSNSYLFSDGQRILFICPESFTRANMVKILHKIGMEKLSNTLESREHYWVRISGIMNDDGQWHNEPKFISMITGINLKPVYSSAHLNLLSKLGIDVKIPVQQNLAGDTEPSTRIVVRD